MARRYRVAVSMTRFRSYEPPLVPSPKGFRWSRRNFSRAWDITSRRVGLPEPQRRDLLRTAVVFMAQAGLSPAQISAITGHRIETTVAILNTYLPRAAYNRVVGDCPIHHGGQPLSQTVTRPRIELL